MRKILFLFVIASFIGCSKDSDEEDVKKPEKAVEYKLNKTDITGVWAENNYSSFFSFSSDKLFSGLIDDYTIEDGDYTIVGDTILVTNTYQGYNIKIVITGVTENTISGNIKYLAHDSGWDTYENMRSFSLKKTTDTPCGRRNALIGKNFATYTNYNGGSQYHFSVIQYNFMTYMLKKVGSSYVNYSGITHYVYLPPYIYYTTYNDDGVFLHNGQTVVNIARVTIDSDGSVKLSRE